MHVCESGTNNALKYMSVITSGTKCESAVELKDKDIADSLYISIH